MAKWVSAYYLGWFWDWSKTKEEAIARVDPSCYSHLVFGRYVPGGGSKGGLGGDLLPWAGTGHAAVEIPLIEKTHTAGKRALMMIGGAGEGKGWFASTQEDVRPLFISRILDKVIDLHYDGVDVDWEENCTTPDEQACCLAFLQDLRAEAAVRMPGTPFEITYPGPCLNLNQSPPSPSGFRPQVARLVDQYNLMSYAQAYNAPGWYSWHFAALKGHWTGGPTSIAGTVNAYASCGVPRTKIGMGIGLYGLGYRPGTPSICGMRQKPISICSSGGDHVDTWARYYRGGVDGSPGFNMMEEGLHQESRDGTQVLTEYVWDADAGAGFYRYTPALIYKGATWYTPQQYRVLSIEDERSIAVKGAWAKSVPGCGGTIVWAINYGWVRESNPPMEFIRSAFLS